MTNLKIQLRLFINIFFILPDVQTTELKRNFFFVIVATTNFPWIHSNASFLFYFFLIMRKLPSLFQQWSEFLNSFFFSDNLFCMSIENVSFFFLGNAEEKKDIKRRSLKAVFRTRKSYYTFDKNVICFCVSDFF